MSLLPFIAQNFGAGRMDRVRTVYRGATTFAFGFGLAIALAFTFAARLLAGFFSKDPEVIGVLVSYIRITCFGYGMLEVHRYATFCMTGIHRPLISTALNTLRLVVLLLPLAYLGSRNIGALNTLRLVVLLLPLAYVGSRIIGLTGIFWARLATDVLAGATGVVVVLWQLGRTPAAHAAASEAALPHGDGGAASA